MQTVVIDGFVSFTLAICLLFIGKFSTMHFETLRKYSIPEPVIGGFICAIIVSVIYYFFNTTVEFELEARDTLLLYFFLLALD